MLTMTEMTYYLYGQRGRAVHQRPGSWARGNDEASWDVTRCHGDGGERVQCPLRPTGSPHASDSPTVSAVVGVGGF